MHYSDFYAKRFLFNSVSDIPEVPGPAPAMPLGSAYLQAGTYSLFGKVWDCNQDGLYVFKHPNYSYFVNRIVHRGNLTDIYNLLSSVSYNHVHGLDDESYNYQVVSNGGIYHRWRLRCGFIAGMMAWLVPQLGFTARVINVATNLPSNGYDDGHIVLETQHSGVWRMWDLSNGCYFKDASGNHMSSADLIAWFQNNPSGLPDRVMLSPLAKKVSSDFASGMNLDFGRYGEFLADPEFIEDWYRRVFQKVV